MFRNSGRTTHDASRCSKNRWIWLGDRPRARCCGGYSPAAAVASALVEMSVARIEKFSGCQPARPLGRDEFVKQDGQAVGFLPGGSAGTPDADPGGRCAGAAGLHQFRQHISAQGFKRMAVAEERCLSRGHRLDDGFLQRQAFAARQFLLELFEAAAAALAHERFQAMLDQVRLVVTEHDATQPVDQPAQFVEGLAGQFHVKLSRDAKRAWPRPGRSHPAATLRPPVRLRRRCPACPRPRSSLHPAPARSRRPV